MSSQPTPKPLSPKARLRHALRRLRFRLAPGGGTMLHLHDTIEGQLHLKESNWLFRTARGRANIVEIGSFRGRSTALLAAGAGPGGRVTAIDPHLDFEQDSTIHYGDADGCAFDANMLRAGVAARVRKLRLKSSEALGAYGDAPIDMLWIDGDHHYPAVLDDLTRWGPLVRVGGVVACHDYLWWADVRRAWAEVIASTPRWKVEGQVESIIWATRRA
ncbi:hypothetical protein BH11PLA1_BH11PLA1_03450 [soil metagenome]